MMPFSTGLGWSVSRSLGRTRTAADLQAMLLLSPAENKKEEGSARASPVAAPMPKSVPS